MSTSVSYPEAGHRVLRELEETSFWFNHRNDVLTSAIRRFPPPGPILDVGGGNGYVSLALKREGFEPTVVEPGAEGARTARERGLEVIEAPFQDLSLEAGSLAAIGAFDVVEHIEDDGQALRNFHGLLTPGGRLYLAVPAYGWLWSHEDEAAGHFRRYSLSQLQERVAGAGFTVLYGSYYFACLVAPLFALRTLPSFLGLRRESTPERTAAEHAPLRGAVRMGLNTLFDLELRNIAAGRRVPFGTSLFVIAEKARD